MYYVISKMKKIHTVQGVCNFETGLSKIIDHYQWRNYIFSAIEHEIWVRLPLFEKNSSNICFKWTVDFQNQKIQLKNRFFFYLVNSETKCSNLYDANRIFQYGHFFEEIEALIFVNKPVTAYSKQPANFFTPLLFLSSLF